MMVAFGYHGSGFHGSQIQPDVRTVQGEFVKALRRLGWWSEGCIDLSSRTDAGVSVRMNLAVITLPDSLRTSLTGRGFVSAINDHLPGDLVAWRAQWVPEGTRPRSGASRTYVYRCEMVPTWPQQADSDLFAEACSAFVGEHDFTNFCRLDGERSPVRTIDSCEPWTDASGRVVGFSVSGQAFLWNQVRRLASAVQLVLEGEISVDDIRSALENPQAGIDYGRAPGECLILWGLNHIAFDGPADKVPRVEGFSAAPSGERAHRQWLNLARIENAALLEREWLALIKGEA